MFFGSSNFSIYVLKSLLKKYKVDLIVTLPAKPAGRKLKLELNIVTKFALKEKIPFFELTDWTTFKNYLNSFDLDKWLGIIAGFGKIIPPEIIKLFTNGILNVHPSLLPKYRGPNPIREVILNNEEKTGITIIFIDELVDHGPIIKQKSYYLTGDETYETLEEKLGLLGGKLLSEVITDLSTLTKEEIEKLKKDNKQNDKVATYTRRITKEDGHLTLKDDYDTWQRKIRALNPWPSTFIYINLRGSKKILKIFSIEKLNKNEIPKDFEKIKIGQFFQFRNKLGLRLKDAFILINWLQLQDRKKMNSSEFLNGYHLSDFYLENSY